MMKLRSTLVFLMAVSLVAMVGTVSADEKWTEVGKDIRFGKAKEKGWPKDEKAKCFMDPTGEILKLVTGEHGTFFIHLKTQTVQRMVGEKKVDEPVMKLIQRSGGNMVVFRGAGYKARIGLKKVVPGVKKYLSGITQSM